MDFKQALPSDIDPTAIDNAVWLDVLQAVDRTYAELVDYQERLEKQNEELRALRQFLGSVLASISDILVVVDRSGTIEEASASVETMLGRPKDQIIGATVLEAVESDEAERLSNAISYVLSNRAKTSLELTIATVEGSAPFDVSITPRLDQRGKSIGAVLTGRPLGELRRAYTELEASHVALKQAQAQVVRNEKLASLGRLLAGVAHELNNPISFVYANAHALEKYADRFESYFERVQAGATRDELINLRHDLKLDRELRNLRAAIDGARDGAERVRDIVEDLRRLSAEGTGEAARFNLAETARVAASWVKRGSKCDTDIPVEGPDELWAHGRPGHIQQVVMNLVQNALDAVAAKAEPSVKVELFTEGDIAVLQVSDNGEGVPEAIRSAIFDPFFTTKDVGKGTGLGLSISHKIAHEHGGHLRLCEHSGPGACFRLELPLEGTTP
ncbi:sensor histidine kinase [Actibacterium lipolyticum]|uniref:histidine kinase n=1 Tax=Actibacterium lipolyticum TaxID=1524263 RepID=A0A238JJ52_9RHOB|nr:ATP-binding protein [Actibacterium lipolyticum]SMX30689.1 Sensor protein FixL [Actibacterium lipolyticum]